MSPQAPHLVFGDDGSASADVVWLWIMNHLWPGWRVSVVSAQPPPPGPPVGPERSSPHPWTPPSPRRLFSAHDTTAVEHLMAEADPRVVLDSFEDAALMAVGPRGRGVLKLLHIGSTVEWLVSTHRPLVPLVIVRSARPTRNVLLCVDGSAHARRAVHALVGMPWIGAVHVTILGVSDKHAEAERGVAEATNLLQAHGVDLTARLTPAIPQVASLDVNSIILNTIAADSPDLVVVGARGVGGIRRRVLGSTASAVLHHAPCSVLVGPGRDDGGAH